MKKVILLDDFGEDSLTKQANKKVIKVSGMCSGITISHDTLSILLQTMEVSDFTSTVACFMRLSWAAAAGRLDLVGSSQPIKESNSLFPAGIRNRLSSSGTD